MSRPRSGQHADVWRAMPAWPDAWSAQGSALCRSSYTVAEAERGCAREIRTNPPPWPPRWIFPWRDCSGIAPTRACWRTTLVVFGTEFGRSSPGARGTGRDHHRGGLLRVAGGTACAGACSTEARTRLGPPRWTDGILSRTSMPQCDQLGLDLAPPGSARRKRLDFDHGGDPGDSRPRVGVAVRSALKSNGAEQPWDCCRAGWRSSRVGRAAI